jgi:enamine deaminase RidA (YjgF/YER057c/UK114 family)
MKKLVFAFIVMSISTQISAQQINNPPALFDPIPYGFSHVIAIPADRKFVFVAGQGGEEDTSGKLSNDFRRQTQYALRNIETALRSQGLDMKSIVKVTTLVVEHDAEKLRILTEEFYKVWPDKKFPVNTLIPVPRLAIDKMLVEIDAIAVSK